MNDKNPWRDEQKLHEKYVEQDKSTYEVADELGCSQKTVSFWIEKHEIVESNQCELCDRSFATPGGLNRHYANFHDEKRSHIKFECTQCGEESERLKSNIKEGTDNLFCSNECQNEWQSENLVGEDNPMYGRTGERASMYGRTGEDNPMYGRTGEDHPTWNGGYEDYYGSSWYRQRRRALERDNHECQICKTKEREHKDEYGRGLDVHHIQKFRKFDDSEKANRLSNLVTLCQCCHKKAEKMSPLVPDTLPLPDQSTQVGVSAD